MPPLVDRPIWVTPPAVFVQKSVATTAQPKEQFAQILAAISPLNVLLRELDGHLDAEDYNDLTLRLDPLAHKKAYDYLSHLGSMAIHPKPELTPDGDGGIEIEWENNGKRLVLSCKAHPDDIDFISWREAHGQYDGEPANQRVLNDRLTWLIS